MQRSKVVLPEPLGPMIDTFSPRATSREMPESTSSSRKRLCRSTIWRRGAIDCAAHRLQGRESARPYISIRLSSCEQRPLEAVRGRQRLVILRPVDADARILGRRYEPGLVAHAV